MYLASVRARSANGGDLSYRDQVDRLLDDYYGWPASVARRVREKGHDVEIVILNDVQLQRTWAGEEGIVFSDKDWATFILRAQVERCKPDILWMGMGLRYFGPFLRTLKLHCRKLFVWIARPQPDDTDLTGIDCVLTSHDVFVDKFRRMGKPCEKLLPAFEPKILEQISRTQRDVELSFVGDLSPAHRQRLHTVKKLVRETPLQLWGTCMRPPPITGFRSLGRRLWHRLFVDEPVLRQRFQGDAWGIDLYRVLCRSSMTFNSHIDIAAHQAGNMRMFEATGCGAALLTEHYNNLPSLFEPGREVIAYEDEEDLLRKALYFLEHPHEAAEIAASGQKRTLTEHTTSNRAGEFLAIGEKYL